MGVIEETMKLSLFYFSAYLGLNFFPLTLYYFKQPKQDKCVPLFPLTLSVQL